MRKMKRTIQHQLTIPSTEIVDTSHNRTRKRQRSHRIEEQNDNNNNNNGNENEIESEAEKKCNLHSHNVENTSNNIPERSSNNKRRRHVVKKSEMNASESTELPNVTNKIEVQHEQNRFDVNNAEATYEEQKQKREEEEHEESALALQGKKKKKMLPQRVHNSSKRDKKKRRQDDFITTTTIINNNNNNNNVGEEKVVRYTNYLNVSVEKDGDEETDSSAVMEEKFENHLQLINPPTIKLICKMHEELKACALAEKELKELLITRKEIRTRVQELCGDWEDTKRTLFFSSSPFALSPCKKVVVRLNVGGELFVIPVNTLLGKDSHTYFHLLFGVTDHAKKELPSSLYSLQALPKEWKLRWEEIRESAIDICSNEQKETVFKGINTENATNTCYRSYNNNNDNSNADNIINNHFDKEVNMVEQINLNKFKSPLFLDDTGAIFIDRDPATFRYILSYLRGYTHLKALDDDVLSKIKVDARYFELEGLLEMLGETNKKQRIRFLPGPGINPEGTRLRVIYGIAMIGESYMLAGRHRITFEVIRSDYVGLGVASDACVNADQEFHRTANCCIYYMSGVFYSNFPHHRKEENLARFESGEFVTIDLDMDKRVLEFTLKNSKKILSIGQARRLRFAVTMKLSSVVRIVPNQEYEQICRERATALEASTLSANEAQANELLVSQSNDNGNHAHRRAGQQITRTNLHQEIEPNITSHHGELSHASNTHVERLHSQQFQENQENNYRQRQQEQEEEIDNFNSVWEVVDESADLHSLFYDEMFDPEMTEESGE